MIYRRLISILFPLLSLILSLAFSPLWANAKTPVAKIGKGVGAYNYWFYEPDSIAEGEAKPLIVFLHGASLCGSNINKVKSYGTMHAIDGGLKPDAYVVAPQNPGGSWRPDKVMDLVDRVSKEYNVDQSRIYVLGMSLGGFGTLDVAAKYPERIAAAMALCGGTTVGDYTTLNQLPLWLVHGTADRAIPVSQSDRVANTLRNIPTDRLIYDRVPGMNHTQPAKILYLKETYDWLLSHSLTDAQRAVNPGFDVVHKSKYAYKDLSLKKRTASKSKTSKSSRSKRNSSRSKSKKK